MNLSESFRTAISALNANKLRSILTMLGVIIGVSAVIALLALGNGFSADIEGEISGIGSNLIFVSTDFDKSDGFPTLSLDDLEALSDQTRAPDLVAVGGDISSSQEILANGRDFNAGVVGITPNYFGIFNLEDDLESGTIFTDFDNETRARVAIIGADVAADLFIDEYPVGQTIKIKGGTYQVIGLFAESEGGIGLNPGRNVFIPIETARSRLDSPRTRNGRPALDSIVASARDTESADAAVDQLTQIIREEHNIAYAADDDFSLQTQADLLESIGNILGTATLFVGIVAGISLLVGGIGIMNIMLVSVTERTREIGIRKSLGALRRDILTQFLIESLFLSLIGGIIGVFFGWVFSVIGESFAGFDAKITPQSIALAIGFSVGVGVVFGVYPAFRASRLRPIDALRYE